MQQSDGSADCWKEITSFAVKCQTARGEGQKRDEAESGKTINKVGRKSQGGFKATSWAHRGIPDATETVILFS